MNNHLKLAYDAGAHQALEDHGFTKEAFGQGMGYQGLDVGTTLRNLPTLVRADLGDAGLDIAMRKAEAARAAGGLGRRAVAFGGGLLGAAAGAAPGLLATTAVSPALTGAGAVLGSATGRALTELAVNKGVRDAIFTEPGKLELLREYLKGNTPTGRFARRAGIAGLAGLGAAGLYNLAKDD